MQGTRENQENHKNIKKIYQENPDIQREYEKSRFQVKKKRCDKVRKFQQTSKTGTLLYFHYMSSKPVSAQC